MARKKPENTEGTGIGKVVPEKKVYSCAFKLDGKCQGSLAGRICDEWLCEWHYREGYADKVREYVRNRNGND